MTTKDYALEANFVTDTMINKNVYLGFDLSYIYYDINKNTWGEKRYNEHKRSAYRGVLTMRYTF